MFSCIFVILFIIFHFIGAQPVPHIPDIYRLCHYKMENCVAHDKNHNNHKTSQNNVFVFVCNILHNFPLIDA
jgi:hypothetical protein